MMNQRRLCVHGERCRPSTFKQLLNCRILHNENPSITIEVVSERCAIKLSRLRKYVADSEPDQIPFLALLRVADFLQAWDIVDFALQQYRRRTESLDAPTKVFSPLNEAVDVTLRASSLLEAVRHAMEDGRIDDSEKPILRDCTRVLRRELDEVDASIDQGGAK